MEIRKFGFADANRTSLVLELEEVFSLRTKLPVAMRPGETPVHIPNTMVKTWTADDTMLETTWESRWLPDYLKNLSVIRDFKSLRFLMTDKHQSTTYLENFIQKCLMIIRKNKIKTSEKTNRNL